MANLTSDKNLDKHLKIIKSGEENTSLELATEGNGAKVNGDFEVTGKYDTIYLKNNSHIKSNDDINLDVVAGTNVNFRVSGKDYLNWSADTGLTMKALTDIDDQVNLVVGSNGQFTISTQDDSDNDLADIILDAEGDIILDSNSGKFIAKKAGTEFSASNSAYAGMILGYTCLLNDAADTSYAVTASFVTVDSTAKVTFTAPPSGNVEIFASVFCKWTTNRWLQFGLSDNATYNTLDVTHEHFIGEGDETDEMQINHRWVITGLTAGTSYTYYLGAKAEQASRVTLYWGGDATGEYAPFIMKATALPTTIYDGT